MGDNFVLVGKPDNKIDGQTQAPSADEGHEQPATTQIIQEAHMNDTEGASNGGGGDLLSPPSSPGHDEAAVDVEARGEVMETTPPVSAATTDSEPEDTVASTEKDKRIEGDESGVSVSTLTPGVVVTELEDPAGSGMQPPLSEEGGASKTTPLGEPEATQSSTESEPKVEIKDDGKDAETESKEKYCLHITRICRGRPKQQELLTI